MAHKDQNSEGRGGQRRKNLYDSPKGRLRLEVLWGHMLDKLPELHYEGRPLAILDAGCGTGHVAARLAALGHQVTACDSSVRLIEQAQSYINACCPEAQVSYVPAPFQTLLEQPQRYQLITCHAVLEWLPDPGAAVQTLAALLAPQGRLSLMFYNVNALIFKNLVRGNLYSSGSASTNMAAASLAPGNPLDPLQVQHWLHGAGLTISARAGIRTFYDYMSEDDRRGRSIEELIDMERLCSTSEPFMGLGRYLHWICQHRSAA